MNTSSKPVKRLIWNMNMKIMNTTAYYRHAGVEEKVFYSQIDAVTLSLPVKIIHLRRNCTSTNILYKDNV
jgi:hypothetical protein